MSALAGRVPGASPSSVSRKLQRCANRLARVGQARKAGATWEIYPGEDIAGKTAGEWLRESDAIDTRGTKLPPAHETWSEKDRQRYLDTRELLKIWDAFRSRHDRSAEPMFPLHRVRDERLPSPNATATMAEWCDRRGLSCKPRALRAYRRRISVDGNVDRRGQGSSGTTIAPQAWELFRSLYLSANRIKLSRCYRYVAGEAQRKKWAWPSLSAIRIKVKAELPHGAVTLARQGNKTFEADCVPKMQRDYDDLLAGEWWCLDGRTLDSFVRIPDDRREWRAVRPVLTGVLDMRSRCLRIDVRSTESADGILAGIKRALLDWGAPAHVIADNGTAYKAAAGTPRGTRRQRSYFDDPRIGSVFAQVGAQVHNSIPYHAWAKQIESIWNKFKEDFDRWCWHFWGGTPQERPADQARRIRRRIDELPTLDELRQLLLVYLDEYHATEQGGRGTRGLAPNLVFEQYRAPIRHVTSELAALLCTTMRGPVTVHRDGVRHNKIRYGQAQPEVWRLQGQRVWLRIDPDRADQVTLCNQAGKPLVVATNQRLEGATQEHRREAHRLQARYRRMMREYAQASDFVRQTPTRQILETKRAHALAREAEQRAQLPAAASPDVQLVRPDLAAAAHQVQQQSRRAHARSCGDDDYLDERGTAHKLLRSAAPHSNDEADADETRAALLRRLCDAG